ncbi:hypothetical protein RHSIM_Rhsim11G0080700 [Rhododendron simsii]|uniref:Uncharacterized protein n=1 Tax=Rhododendron simsii TaxID=118357 RepID=A0A834GBD0_RHOSS|nr:hypothetical protein RHSIM_Rhsim11G0080700 [Rhododendron simsii]
MASSSTTSSKGCDTLDLRYVPKKCRCGKRSAIRVVESEKPSKGKLYYTSDGGSIQDDDEVDLVDLCIVCALHNFVDNEMKLGSSTVAKEGPPTSPDDEALPPLSAHIAVTPLPVPLPIGCDDEPVGGCEDPAPLPLPVLTVVTTLPVAPLPTEVVIPLPFAPLPVEVVIPFPFASLPVAPLPAPVLVP